MSRQVHPLANIMINLSTRVREHDNDVDRTCMEWSTQHEQHSTWQPSTFGSQVS